MFFEAVVRVCLKRFHNYGAGECKTHELAMKKAMETIKQNWTFDNWEEWRWLHLYQVPVHDTLNANITQLKMLYQNGRKP